MMYIFFDLYVLVDRQQAAASLMAGIGHVMRERYGVPRGRNWEEAYQCVRQDWDSYYADLDLGGENGMEHLWEGLYRTTRALFRLTGTDEPHYPELRQLSR
jgi:hypothetical protein